MPSFGLPGRPVIAGLAFAGVVASVLVGWSSLETVVGCGIAVDDYPSQTAKDWITYADHVVVASPTAEKDTNRRDYKTGSVGYITDREVTFRTDDTLWSAEQPDRALGDEFTMTAEGWSVYRESGTRVKRTAANASRLEPGHTYLLALRWTDEGWTVLGEGAAVPFDDDTADQGEWCGRVLPQEDIASAERFSRKDDHSLEKAIQGQDKAAVTRELTTAAKD